MMKYDRELREQAAREKGEILPAEDGLTIVIPSPTPGINAISPLEEEPRVITPGSRLVQ
jgi:hypothetical protein